MIRSRWRTHNDLPVAIGFNAALDFRKLSVRQQLIPAPQVGSHLVALGRKVDSQRRHAATVLALL
jgi:hypothetical protein